jgi:phage-related minor tail protein
MGEAGPEAIMPLKRDANGNLGVRGTKQEAQTTVVVNNYSGEKATAKETTDSNGNRKIEVIVGEMVAGEINRSGSAAQQAIGGTFGHRPAIVRR